MCFHVREDPSAKNSSAVIWSSTNLHQSTVWRLQVSQAPSIGISLRRKKNDNKDISFVLVLQRNLLTGHLKERTRKQRELIPCLRTPKLRVEFKLQLLWRMKSAAKLQRPRTGFPCRICIDYSPSFVTSFVLNATCNIIPLRHKIRPTKLIEFIESPPYSMAMKRVTTSLKTPAITKVRLDV